MCTKCNEITGFTNPCSQCTDCQEPDCSCAVKDLQTDCVLYTGEDLTCSGISSNTVLTDVLQQMDAFICAKFNSITGFFNVVNIGVGAEVYKGTSLTGQKELRTLLSTNDVTLQIQQNGDNISFTVPNFNTDTYLEGASLVGNTLTLSMNDGNVYQVPLEAILSDDIRLSAVDFNDSTNDLTLTMSNFQEFTVNLGSIDTKLQTAVFNPTSKILTLGMSDGTPITVDLTVPEGNDIYLNGVTYNTATQVMSFTLNNGAVRTVDLPVSSEVQKGLIEIASQAEVDAGSDDTRAVTPLKLKAAIANIPTPDAGLQALTFTINTGWGYRTIYPFSTGLSVMPVGVFFRAKCIVSEASYPVGSIITLVTGASQHENSGGDSQIGGLHGYWTAAGSVSVFTGHSIGGLAYNDRSYFNLTPSRWQIFATFIY